MKVRNIFALLLFTSLLFHCSAPERTSTSSNDLFEGFVNPPAEAKPFLRWWWNGNHINEQEIVRQLDVLQAAGIGGVEINPIAMPPGSADVGTRALTWLSKEWNELLVFAARETNRRGMIADLIVGSGWPFGGEFVQIDETIQRIIPHRILISGGTTIQENERSLYNKAIAVRSPRLLKEKVGTHEVHFVKLVPKGTKDFSEVIDLTDQYKKNKELVYRVPDGEYELVYALLEKSVREVMHGAPGAAGPVMNHYEKDITLAYLNRLKKISEDTGVPLGEIIRALFCDSIELSGANWTDNFEEIFYQEYQYRMEPYYSVVFYDPYQGYDDEKYDAEFMDKVRRVRHDYNRLLVKVFLENFTQVFHDFCNENGMLSRYQAYGTPFLMGMMEGNMIADIPESNNWIYSGDAMQDEHWKWNQGHGYMIWNLYASSGGHLTRRKIISNEAMTNTRGVFKTSLDEIKQHDDMNFVTGMNHAVLHGYNYSPVEAGFPGWIRYGSYFSEQNTWWPYFIKWADYNARLSYLFQESDPVKNIAIIGPQSDVWSDNGLYRVPFHMTPWYCYRLWEPISQAGNSCDYITESIVQQANVSQGRISYGPMSYQAIILTSIESMEPQTATALQEFVKGGGKLVIVDGAPRRSVSMNSAGEGDATVKRVFSELINNNPERVFSLNAPRSQNELLSWTKNMLSKMNIDADVKIDNPDISMYQIRKKAGDLDIYFFTNTNRLKPMSFNASFPTGNKIPWVWNPETGTRSVYPYGNQRDQFNIQLQPLQSLLLVFDPKMSGKQDETIMIKPGDEVVRISGPWKVSFKHMNGRQFERDFKELVDFGTSNDNELNTFAGTVTYSTTFRSDGSGEWLELGKVNKGVTEVFVNGKKAGINWYGRPLFRVEGLLVNGDNKLEIKYTTVLSNYAMSLKDNPTAQIWTEGFELIPMGLEGDVKILNNVKLEVRGS
jgi:hypothetical protein